MQPTHSPVLQVPATTSVARTLRNAAMYLRRHGWIQGAYYDTSTDAGNPAACTVGAIGMVCYGHPYDAPAQRHGRPGHDEFEASVSYLDQTLKNSHGQDDVYSWNDDRARTMLDVLTMLDTAADTCEGTCPVDGAR